MLCIHELLSPVESQHLQLYNWSYNYSLRFKAIFSPFYQLLNWDKSYPIFLSELQLYKTMYAYIKLKMRDSLMKTVERSTTSIGFHYWNNFRLIQTVHLESNSNKITESEFILFSIIYALSLSLSHSKFKWSPLQRDN